MHFEVHRLHNEANFFMKLNSYIFKKIIKNETISKASKFSQFSKNMNETHYPE